MSKSSKVLLFGKHGQVGHELQSTLQALGEVIALDVDSTEGCGDFSRPDDVVATVRRIKPNIIINAAAYTAVDKAESEPELARIINATTPGTLAVEAEKLGAWFVHYSTDYVFDGSGDVPWQETDIPAPLNIYGKTKLEGEQLIAKACKRHLIIRTSWVYGAHGNNFAKTMLRLAQERDSLAVVDDQVGAPTSARLLAGLTVNMLQKAIQKESLTGQSLAGLYHAVAAGEVSWHGYAKYVIAHARLSGSQIKVLDSDIKSVSSDLFPTPAKRPHNSRLSTLKLQQAFDIKLPEWQTGVTEMLDQLLMGNCNDKA